MTDYKHFDLVETSKELERYSVLGKQWEASCIAIPSVHEISFHGLNIYTESNSLNCLCPDYI
jgi:hypothetical protein